MANLRQGFSWQAVKKTVGIVGARSLPEKYKNKVQEVVKYLVEKGYRINTGGAMGTDQFVLEILISLGQVNKGKIFSAWNSISGFPKPVQKFVDYFLSHNEQIHWGEVSSPCSNSVAVAALLGRNKKLVEASSGLIAFMYGESKGTIYTIKEACKKGIRVVVFRYGDKTFIPIVGSGRWSKMNCSEPWNGAFIYQR